MNEWMNENYILLSHATFINENNSQQCMNAYDYVKILIEKTLECTKLLLDVLNQMKWKWKRNGIKWNVNEM